jgi:Heterokaryon incompatibility protein (HET)
MRISSQRNPAEMAAYTYTYTPLNDPCTQIRILQLQLGSYDVPLSFNSYIHTLDDVSDDYHALSYEWGPPEPKQVVLVDGETLEIRHNLWLFHKEIRSQMAAELPLRLWCDAICMYSNRSRIKHCKNLRFDPLFSEGFDFAHLLCHFLKPKRVLTTLRLLALFTHISLFGPLGPVWDPKPSEA